MYARKGTQELKKLTINQSYQKVKSLKIKTDPVKIAFKLSLNYFKLLRDCMTVCPNLAATQQPQLSPPGVINTQAKRAGELA